MGKASGNPSRMFGEKSKINPCSLVVLKKFAYLSKIITNKADYGKGNCKQRGDRCVFGRLHR